MDKCSNWINQAQNVPEFFWIELKKEGFENCPSSISLAIKKVKQEICFYAAVEIKDINASEYDFKRHNKILDMNLPNEEFYYSGDNCKYFHAGNDNEVVKELIEKSIIKKVRIQKEFNLFLNKTRKEIVDEIVDTIKKLEVYYNMIIEDYNRNTENDSKNYSNLNNEEKSSFGWIIPCNPKYYDGVSIK